MKIKLTILVSLIVLNSCRFKKTEREFEKISLKGGSNFDDICNLVHENSFQNIKSVVEIMDGENLKTISLYGAQSSGHRLNSNELVLTWDSINAYDIGTLPRKKLKKALKKFYLNRGDNGFVVIRLESTRTSKDLENILLNLKQEFDKMNGETEQSYNLSIFLSCIKPETSRPPPPQN